jgi:hypothetical protein
VIETSAVRRVRVVVTCTRRKTRPISRSLHMRNVPGARLSTRFRHWTERLTNPAVQRVPALDLYAGEHWTIARRLCGEAEKPAKIDLWVCSAGYGLIPVDAPIAPYSATFVPGDPDSVPGTAADWWETLADWEGPVGGARSFVELVSSDPSARLILVLSAAYLRACHNDICKAAEKLSDPRLLSILSAGTKHDRDLSDFLLPVDARLQPLLGGTLQALNIRATEDLLTTGLDSHDNMSASLQRLLAEQPPPRRYNRRRATDAELRSFIRDHLRSNPLATHTRLLRELRDADYASEQGRFAALFDAETRRDR